MSWRSATKRPSISSGSKTSHWKIPRTSHRPMYWLRKSRTTCRPRWNSSLRLLRKSEDDPYVRNKLVGSGQCGRGRPAGRGATKLQLWRIEAATLRRWEVVKLLGEIGFGRGYQAEIARRMGVNGSTISRDFRLFSESQRTGMSLQELELCDRIRQRIERQESRSRQAEATTPVGAVAATHAECADATVHCAGSSRCD